MKRNNCPYCGNNDWRENQIYRIINPDGEYVVGFGHAQCAVPDRKQYWCNSCG